MTEEEIWKTIPGYSDYQISSLGRVKSLKRGKERILKQSKNKRGYLIVNLYNESKYKTLRVHRLLAMAFLGVQENMEVDHINGDPTDNRLENIRWCTREENSRNCGKPINNTTGFPGVSFIKATGKFHACISINGRTKHLGHFGCPEEAFIACRDASLELFGEFSPFVTRDEFRALSEQVEGFEGAV